MPCYEINTVSIKFNPENAAILAAALRVLGWTMVSYGAAGARITTDTMNTVYLANGQATGQAQDVNALRVGYSRAAVKNLSAWAKENGWSVSVKSDNKLSLSKGVR